MIGAAIAKRAYPVNSQNSPRGSGAGDAERCRASQHWSYRSSYEMEGPGDERSGAREPGDVRTRHLAHNERD